MLFRSPQYTCCDIVRHGDYDGCEKAYIGIAGGEGCGLVFKKGEIIRKVPEEKLVDALMEEVEKL